LQGETVHQGRFGAELLPKSNSLTTDRPIADAIVAVERDGGPDECRVAGALRLAIAMDAAQRKYFKGRGRDELIAARQAETAFRKAIA
jgi:hypothetical protein